MTTWYLIICCYFLFLCSTYLSIYLSLSNVFFTNEREKLSQKLLPTHCTNMCLQSRIWGTTDFVDSSICYFFNFNTFKPLISSNGKIKWSIDEELNDSLTLDFTNSSHVKKKQNASSSPPTIRFDLGASQPPITKTMPSLYQATNWFLSFLNYTQKLEEIANFSMSLWTLLHALFIIVLLASIDCFS